MINISLFLEYNKRLKFNVHLINVKPQFIGVMIWCYEIYRRGIQNVCQRLTTAV